MSFDSQYLLYISVQALWVLVGAIWFWRRQDELPLMISGFLLYVFSFRFWALLHGLSAPVDISPFGFDPITTDLGIGALGTATLGETALLAAYVITQNQVLGVRSLVASPRLLRWIRSRVFIFAAVAIPAALVARRLALGQAEAGKVMAFEVSAYLYELPLVLISVALLLALLWKFGGMTTPLKLVSLPVIGIVAWITYGPTGRFQFIGWVLAVTIIATTGQNIQRRVLTLVSGFGVAIVLFAAAGASRNLEEGDSLRQGTWERLLFAEDANMLDGLVLLQEVYPSRLPYSYGGEHLEILERPIPRALWPGKPVGGYMNKLGITSASTGFTLGISPGLVGSFYQEGGLAGVVLFSILYGHVFGRLVRSSNRLTPITGVLIRAVCCSSLIPLLRGGDLPGIFAWLFMSFWPCFLLLWWQRRAFFARRLPPGRRRNPPRLRPFHPEVQGVLRPE